MLDQGARNREFDGIGLTVHAATVGNGFDVELFLQACDLKWLENVALQGEGREDVFEGVVIDDDFSGSGSDPDAGNGLLATSGCGKCFAHGIISNEFELKSNGFGLLRFVRVFFTCIDFELLHLGGTQLGFGDHAFDGPLKYEFGTTLTDLRGSLDGLATDEAGVACIDFMALFASGEAGLVSIDDDDEVTGINVGREDCFILTAQENGGLHGDFSDDLVLGIDNVP